MPERNYDSIDIIGREAIANYVPGYDWMPGRFGPPPGIPKARKEQLDQMTDKEYLYSFLKMTQEEKESLMVSEAERRRTYTAHWPIESIIKAADLAKEGFYYTGTADRVQCAFCAGIIRNWDRGDIPKIQHKNFFNYCKMVQNKPCHNIPIQNCPLPGELQTDQLSSSLNKDARQATLGDLNINTVKPKAPKLSVYSKRWESYLKYPSDNPVPAKDLCESGFFYEGEGDKVKCFWCDGALEMWTRGDDPWVEHAKWYAGCTFVQQNKGLDFIRRARADMTPENRATAETLVYNKGDTTFLDIKPEPIEEPIEIDKLEGYQYLTSLEYSREIIVKAYAANENNEFKEQGVLVTIVQDLADGNTSSLEEYMQKVKERQENPTCMEEEEMEIISHTKPLRRVNVAEIVANANEPSAQESKDFIDALTCRKCRRNISGAVVLPCGCFCLCQDCSKKNLPKKCPTCGNVVKGACRTFLA